MLTASALTAGWSSAHIFFWAEDWSTGSSHLLLIFIGITAVAMLSQALVMVILAIGAQRAQKDIQTQIAEIKGKLLPLLAKSDILITDLTPKLTVIASRATTIAANAEEISTLVKNKLNEVAPTISAANETVQHANQTVRDANEKTRAQVDRVNDLVGAQLTRVNGMVSDVLDVTAQLGRNLRHTITLPGREISGIVGGVRAALQTFTNGRSPLRKSVYRAPIGIYQPTPPDPFTADIDAKFKPDLEP